MQVEKKKPRSYAGQEGFIRYVLGHYSMNEKLSKYRNTLSDNDVKYHSKKYNDLTRELQYYHAEDCKIVGYNDIDTSQDLTQYGSLEEYAGENAIWTTGAFNRFYLAKFRQEFRKWK